ncbi:hypothetical protein PsorP6_003868 [Peronosclerospora sorghi]|uniref:Uncharacterized protein n=1 Tax=Peronosclerospora sorghi TaxID=230839 RepID=A0ACC0VPJ7_9STRA|nr:hypothetical protein PsorP6_003868 [Peronosclerospora sorghi]
MRCHYEVLGAARDGSTADIKKAYRLQALRWHPDKHNQNNVSIEEATEKFQAIQNAYAVLSDPHEKKWYDEHRDQILRGQDESEFEGDIDLFRYFSTSVYSGFGTDEKSFYSVYGKLFRKIDELDRGNDDNAHFAAAPELGDANTSMNDINYFYQHWKNYATKRNFSTVDEYKTTDAPTRLVRRAMEKENKKLRDAAKKEFNIQVRKLAEFVCRRDPRVLAFQKKKEEEKERQRIEEEAKKLEKQAAYDANRRAFEEHQEKLWADTTNKTSRIADRDIELELDKLRRKLDAEVLFCDMCSKIFKSTKQLQNHLASKKHREKEKQLGAVSDYDISDGEMDRDLQEELIEVGKAKRESNGDNASAEIFTKVKQNDVTNGGCEKHAVDEETARRNAEADKERLKKEKKAADKRRERKAMRKNKKKENVEKIVNDARIKKEKRNTR